MQYEQVGKPYTYDNNWFVFPDTTFSNINMVGCVSSVTGTCENTRNVEECISLCKNSKLPCLGGYFIETPDRQNICVPVQKRTTEILTEPYYRLRGKNMYPILRDMKSSVFINKILEYPPDHANSIFYTDNLVLKNIKTDMSIGINETNDKSQILSSKPIFVQFLPRDMMSFALRHVHVKHGDEMVVNIPNTSYILEHNNSILSWVKQASTSFENPITVLRIYSMDPDKKIGDPLTYTDKIYFTTIDDHPILYDSKTGELTVSNPTGTTDPYQVIPKVYAYYCEKGNCQTVPLEDCQTEKEKARYQGQTVYRTRYCWGMCSEAKHKKVWIILGVLFVLLIILLVYRRYYS